MKFNIIPSQVIDDLLVTDEIDLCVLLPRGWHGGYSVYQFTSFLLATQPSVNIGYGQLRDQADTF